MADLSLAAQTVFDATYQEIDYAPKRHVLWATAATLRAAADQVVPREAMKDPLWAGGAYKQRAETRAYLLAIVSELESQARAQT